MVELIISTQKLKTLSVHIFYQLVHICNLCIDKATWPDALNTNLTKNIFLPITDLFH